MSLSPIQEWLDAYSKDSARVAGGIVMLAGRGAAAPQIAAVAGGHASRQQDLRAAAGKALSKGTPVMGDATIISLPLRRGDRTVGAIALELAEKGASVARAVLEDLKKASRSLAEALKTVEQAETTIDAARVLRLQATLLTHATFHEAATAFATELASILKLDHVAIGFRDGKFSRVAAISNFADFEENAKIFRVISIAMDEAVEQGSAVTFPGIPDDRPRINVAQAELSKARGCTVCSVPLVDNGELIGAVTLERSGSTPLTKEQINDYEQIICIVGPVLALKRELDRPWSWRLRRYLKRYGEQLIGPGKWVAKTASVATVAILASIFLVSADYRVGSPARLEGAIQRALVAPADGFLKEAHVRPGDDIRAGQVLIELAQDDLELERRRWASELEQHENAAPAALARDDRGAFVISRALADEARAKLGLAEEKLARAQVRAPFDGIVITGDLSQTLGAPVRRGETLVTVAPSKEFRLILEVDERDIADVRVGQTGHLALGALPDSNFAFTVKRISPVAKTQEGRNYFDVEAELTQAAPNMRPGLQGVAKVDIEERTIAWILFHRMVDWARIAIWSLGIGS